MERENLIDDDDADKRMKVKTTVLKQTFHYMFLHSLQKLRLLCWNSIYLLLRARYLRWVLNLPRLSISFRFKMFKHPWSYFHNPDWAKLGQISSRCGDWDFGRLRYQGVFKILIGPALPHNSQVNHDHDSLRTNPYPAPMRDHLPAAFFATLGTQFTKHCWIL